MHRAAVIGVALIFGSVVIAFAASGSDIGTIAAYSTFVVGVAILAGLLVYRIWFQNRGENIVAEVIGDADE